MVISQIRDIMWSHVGLVRTESGLLEAMTQLRDLEISGAVQTQQGQNMLTVAQLIAMAALARQESRGAHFRADYPEPADAWTHGSVWTLTALESFPADAAAALPNTNDTPPCDRAQHISPSAPPRRIPA